VISDTVEVEVETVFTGHNSAASAAAGPMALLRYSNCTPSFFSFAPQFGMMQQQKIVSVNNIVLRCVDRNP